MSCLKYSCSQRLLLAVDEVLQLRNLEPLLGVNHI